MDESTPREESKTDNIVTIIVTVWVAVVVLFVVILGFTHAAYVEGTKQMELCIESGGSYRTVDGLGECSR